MTFYKCAFVAVAIVTTLLAGAKAHAMDIDQIPSFHCMAPSAKGDDQVILRWDSLKQILTYDGVFKATYRNVVGRYESHPKPGISIFLDIQSFDMIESDMGMTVQDGQIAVLSSDLVLALDTMPKGIWFTTINTKTGFKHDSENSRLWDVALCEFDL